MRLFHKDAVQAAVLAAEVGVYWKNQGKSLAELYKNIGIS